MTVLKILYQDDDLVAVSKPEKMLTHRTEIANGDTEFALQLLRDQIGRRVNPVYRLDRGTSGVLLFGLNSEIVSALSQQTHETFHKRYYAVARGWTPEDIEIRHALKPPVDPYLRVLEELRRGGWYQIFPKERVPRLLPIYEDKRARLELLSSELSGRDQPGALVHGCYCRSPSSGR